MFPSVMPEGVLVKARMAKTAEDWQVLAKEIEPIVLGILQGRVKATAAQASLIKSILDRAHGRASATQSELRAAAGVIILPALDSGEKMMICPKCGYDAKAPLATE